MDFRLISRLIGDKLRDRTTYGLALVVGTLISAYGQLLVPWIRDGGNPFVVFAGEFEMEPVLTSSSVFLAYAFPFFVGTYSAVASRYKNRRMESIADFPERKPDPVFRATRDGQLVEAGARTQELFERYGVDCAQKILGEETWAQILAAQPEEGKAMIFFEAEEVEYLVRHAPTANGEINLYLTRLCGNRGSRATH